MSDNHDGINKKLTVELDAGQEFKFRTKNISTNKGIYQIKAEFTPEEIILGETKILSIKAGETEYVAYYLTKKGGFNYSLGENGNYMSTAALGQRNNIISSVSVINKKSNAVTNGSIGKYLIGVTNNSASDNNITISIEGAFSIDIGVVNNLEGHNKLYKITSRKAACGMKINTVSSAPTKTTLLDDEFNVLEQSALFSTSSISKLLEENKIYYILITNQNNSNVDVEVTVIESVSALQIGNNCINKSGNSMTYSFMTETDAEIMFMVSERNSLILYNSEWGIINEIEGRYSLNAGEQNYITVHGTAEECEIIVALDYTESLTGNYNIHGYKFIRFTPNVSDYYEITGNTNYAWYNSNLQEHNGKLLANDVYYLKIFGNSNALFSVNILRVATQIQERSILNLTSGLYSFNISESGKYVFNTTKSNNVIASFIILNSQREIISSELTIGEEYCSQFSVGMYFIEIISENNSVGLLINRINADNIALNRNLLSGVEQTISFTVNSDNNFIFTCSSSGEYYLKFAYTFSNLSFKINITDSS